MWLGIFFSALLTTKAGIIGIIILGFLGCVIFIFIKLAYDKFRNKEDNYYDNHIDK